MEKLKMELKCEIEDLKSRKEQHIAKATGYIIQIQMMDKVLRSCGNEKQYRAYVTARSVVLREICRKRTILKVATQLVEKKIKNLNIILDQLK